MRFSWRGPLPSQRSSADATASRTPCGNPSTRTIAAARSGRDRCGAAVAVGRDEAWTTRGRSPGRRPAAARRLPAHGRRPPGRCCRHRAAAPRRAGRSACRRPSPAPRRAGSRDTRRAPHGRPGVARQGPGRRRAPRAAQRCGARGRRRAPAARPSSAASAARWVPVSTDGASTLGRRGAGAGGSMRRCRRARGSGSRSRPGRAARSGRARRWLTDRGRGHARMESRVELRAPGQQPGAIHRPQRCGMRRTRSGGVVHHGGRARQEHVRALVDGHGTMVAERTAPDRSPVVLRGMPRGTGTPCGRRARRATSCRALPGPAAPRMRRSSSGVGAGVSASVAATLTSQPMLARTASSVAPGWSESRRISPVSSKW